MRRLLAPLLIPAALVVSAVLVAPALAEEAAAAAAGAEVGTFSARAIDGTAMLLSSDPHAGGVAAPLMDAPVRLLVQAPGSAARTTDAQTDGEGRFSAVLGELPPGARVTFLIPSSVEQDRPGFLAPVWVVDDEEGPPTDVLFFETLESSRSLYLEWLTQVVTTYEREGAGEKALQMSEIAILRNMSAKVWIGDPASGLDTFHVPYPAAFELQSASVNGEMVEPVAVTAPHGGAAFAYRRPIFPARLGGPSELTFQLTLTAPYENGALLEVLFHPDVEVGRYSLNLEQGALSYVPPPEDAEPQVYDLVDMGREPAMGNVQKPTQAFGREVIPAHVNLGGAILVGRPFPWKAILTAAMILLIAAAGVLLGRGLSRVGRRPERSTSARPEDLRAAAPGAVDVEAQLALLERRVERGEITTIEYQVRRAALEKGPPRAAPATAPSAPPAAPDAAAEIERILARADGASAKQLRKDVRKLGEIARELLGE